MKPDGRGRAKMKQSLQMQRRANLHDALAASMRSTADSCVALLPYRLIVLMPDIFLHTVQQYYLSTPYSIIYHRL